MDLYLLGETGLYIRYMWKFKCGVWECVCVRRGATLKLRPLHD